jgi:hypothetical protein
MGQQSNRNDIVAKALADIHIANAVLHFQHGFQAIAVAKATQVKRQIDQAAARGAKAYIAAEQAKLLVRTSSWLREERSEATALVTQYAKLRLKGADESNIRSWLISYLVREYERHLQLMDLAREEECRHERSGWRANLAKAWGDPCAPIMHRTRTYGSGWGPYEIHSFAMKLDIMMGSSHAYAPHEMIAKYYQMFREKTNPQAMLDRLWTQALAMALISLVPRVVPPTARFAYARTRAVWSRAMSRNSLSKTAIESRLQLILDGSGPAGGNRAIAAAEVDVEHYAGRSPLLRARSGDSTPAEHLQRIPHSSVQEGNEELSSHRVLNSGHDGSRQFDAERKILIEIQRGLPKDAKGTIYLKTNKEICASCTQVIYEFQGNNPGVKVKVFSPSNPVPSVR